METSKIVDFFIFYIDLTSDRALQQKVLKIFSHVLTVGKIVSLRAHPWFILTNR